MGAYYSPDVIAQAKEIDLLTYLKTNNPEELVHFSKNVYTTRTHDSLKISNGKWYWFSRGIGGKNALEYLIQVEEHSFLRAVEILSGITNVTYNIPKKLSEKEKSDRLLLPKNSSNYDKVKNYLISRGISENIIQECIDNNMIYQELTYNNVVFVGFDENKKPRYGGIRATNSSRFMRDATGSDKKYSFRLEAKIETDSIHIFESAIDLLSYATLLELNNINWSDYNLISLAGVYQPAKEIIESKVPIAIKNYLDNNQNIKKIYLHFDNDSAGITATNAIKTLLKDQYEVIDKRPLKGKDVNQYLCFYLGIDEKNRKENER